MPDYGDCPFDLSADFCRPWRGGRQGAGRRGADIVHFDVMDNHYVPQPDKLGRMVCKRHCANYGHYRHPFDVHFMVSRLTALFGDSSKRGCFLITFHFPEDQVSISKPVAAADSREVLPKAVWLFNPATSLDSPQVRNGTRSTWCAD